MSDLLNEIARWSVEVVYSFGYPGIAVLVALSGLNLPIPIQMILPLAGFLAGQGRFLLIPLIAASTSGSVVSALILYLLGYWLGEDRLRRFIERIERFKLVYSSDLNRASRGFERHGGTAILIGHILPVGGSLISIPAGIKRMEIWRFMFYSFLGSAVWNITFIVLGWALGSEWHIVQRYATLLGHTTLAVIAVVIFWFVWHRWRAFR